MAEMGMFNAWARSVARHWLRPYRTLVVRELTLPQLKILQEVITLTVFVPFAVLYMKEPLS